MPVAEYVLKRRAASRAPVVFQKTEEEKKEYVPPSILWTGTEEEWKQKTGQQDKAETIAENIKIKSALPTTTYNVPVDKGRINIERQQQQQPQPIYSQDTGELSPTEKLRKSGEIDIQKASRARQEGKLGFFYEASGQTKQYFADTGESFISTLKKPETALIVAGTLLLTRSPTASRYLTTAFELYSPIYATTEIKAIGERKQTLGGVTGELGAYIGAFKVGKELPRYFGETNINLKAYPTEKKITFVGEGKLKGEKIKAVAVAEEGQSKLFLRKGKSLQITKSTDLLPSQSKIELIDRKLKV